MTRVPRYWYACNGAQCRRSRKDHPKELSTAKNGNVHLRLDALAKGLMVNLPDPIVDLLEIASLVYAADQDVGRSGTVTFDYADKWIRHFRFDIGVRCPDLWRRLEPKLCEFLGFLTQDNYEFHFELNPSPRKFSEYLDFKATDPNPEGVERIVLFSGGLDSLAGAVQEAFTDERRVALVSHVPVTHMETRQVALANLLKNRVGKTSRPVHLKLSVNKSSGLNHDYTQRSRSFLFGATAAVVADTMQLQEIEFYENGIVSANLPLSGQELNGRDSRTTHPQTLHRMSELFSAVLNRPVVVENPFFWLTKQEVVEVLVRHEQADLAKSTISCSHTRYATNPRSHCGLCSQCLYRRFATVGAQIANYDPLDLYRADPLHEPRSDTDQTLAERLVGVAWELDHAEQPDRFFETYATELSRITHYLPGDIPLTLDSLFQLHKRHSCQVGEVLKQEMRESVADVWNKRLSPGSPVWAAFCAINPPSDEYVETYEGRFSWTPDREHVAVMGILYKSGQCLIQAEIRARTKGKHTLCERTIGKILRTLADKDFVCYPSGARKGASLTDKGRAFFAGLNRQSG